MGSYDSNLFSDDFYLYPTFLDVPLNSGFWSYIEGLYAAGVTSGCSTNPLMYCPTQIVTRDQMAVFLLRATHGSSYVPPQATGVFADVPVDYWAAAWIEQLAAEGITGGCGSGNYCPATPVTRDQMAVFLLRAKHGSGYTPPLANGVFQDVPADHWAAGWIEQLADEGITSGCNTNPWRYCPATPVTRDQMAVFLVRTFDIPYPTSTPILGLLGHWKFDESSWAGDCSTADMLDSSGNNRHGIACIDGDAPFPVPGKFGNAGRFDGIDQYANMGPGFNFTSSFTAAMWIALDDYDWCGATGKSQHIIGTHHLETPTGNGRGWGIYWDCDGLAWELTNSTGSAIGSYGYVQPSPFPVNGSWHHIALVYDSSVPSATLYWDGVAVYSETGTANVPSFLFNNGEPLTVNGLPYAPSAGAPGMIDETRVYNRALSADEITSLYEGIDLR